MNIGDIIIVSGNSFISKLIQKVTGSKWTHAALYIGGGYILEIDWHTRAMVSKKSYRVLEYDYAILRKKEPLTKEQIGLVLATAHDYDKAGSQYDFALLLSLFLKKLLPKGKLLRNLNRKNSFICTELIDEVMLKSGIILFPGRTGDLYPQDFLECDDLQTVEIREK